MRMSAEEQLSALMEKFTELQAENAKLKAEMDKWNLSTKNIERDLSFEEENRRQEEALNYIRGKISKWPNMLGYIEAMDEILEGPQ